MQTTDRFNKAREAHRVLLIQLGDIGDIVWSLPALQAVREAYPGADVSVLLREGGGSLLEADDLPPKIFEVRKGRADLWGRLRESLHLIRQLRRERFDMVFDLRADERGGYMAFSTGAPVRVAQYYHGLTWTRNRFFTHLVWPPPDGGPAEEAAEQSLRILRAFGIQTKSTIPELGVSEKITLRAEEILAAEGIAAVRPANEIPEASRNEPGRKAADAQKFGGKCSLWVTINPFSRWSYKEWGLLKWVQIIDWLGQEFGLTVVIVGALSERVRADELGRSCAGKVYNLTGRTTLAELAGVLKQSRLHIGVDSAAPHIAAAVGTPTVTLYGPSDWRYWKPPGERHRVVVPDMVCAPCHQKGCDGLGTSLCLDGLEIVRVQAAIREALSG